MPAASVLFASSAAVTACTLRVSLHLELVYDEHDGAAPMSRVDEPLARPVREVLVGVVRRTNVAAAAADVLHASCTHAISSPPSPPSPPAAAAVNTPHSVLTACSLSTFNQSVISVVKNCSPP